MDRDTLREVRDRSGHPKESPRQDGTPLERSETGRDTLRDFRDGSGHRD